MNVNEQIYIILSDQKESPLAWQIIFSKKNLKKIKDEAHENKKNLESNGISIDKANSHIENIMKLPVLKIKNTKQSTYSNHKNNPHELEDDAYVIASPVGFTVNRKALMSDITKTEVETSWEHVESVKNALKYILKIHTLIHIRDDEDEDYDDNDKLGYLKTEEYKNSYMEKCIPDLNQICKIKKELKNGKSKMVTINLIDDLVCTNAYSTYAIRANGEQGYLNSKLETTSLSKARMFKSKEEAEMTLGKACLYYESIYITKHKIQTQQIVGSIKNNTSDLSKNNILKAMTIKEKEKIKDNIKYNKANKTKQKIM